ncbi:MAG: hypothetical protein ABIT71_09005 [Vicinamibacteraceae bacterium]
MSHTDDELMLLWQQGVSNAPDAAEVARLAARASMGRFDRMISRRNVIESLAAGGVLAWFAWGIVTGHERLSNAVSFGCVSFVVAYLWWQHRHTVALDAAADAGAYHAALVARLDRQIALTRTVPYWYLLPLYVPPALQAVPLWPKNPIATLVFLGVVSAIYVGLGVLNVRVGVARLMSERARLEALYQE